MTEREWKEIAELARQWRDVWREAIEQIAGEASERENWDGTDNNIAGFDRVMDAVSGLGEKAVKEG